MLGTVPVTGGKGPILTDSRQADKPIVINKSGLIPTLKPILFVLKSNDGCFVFLLNFLYMECHPPSPPPPPFSLSLLLLY